MGNLKKGDLEQIYTPKKLTEFMLNELEKVYNIEDITEFLEPAAGAGDMIDVIKERYNKPILAYDIDPKREDIIKADFLKLKNLEYKKGRISILNPPFSKAIKFIDKCYEVSDVVISITGLNTFMNIDYDKLNNEEIYIIKKQPFLDGKSYDICIFVFKNNR